MFETGSRVWGICMWDSPDLAGRVAWRKLPLYGGVLVRFWTASQTQTAKPLKENEMRTVILL